MDVTLAGRIVSNLKQEYSRPASESGQRFSESVIRALQRLHKPGGTVQHLMDDIVQMINRSHKLREVSIGRLFPQDRTYRYVSFWGFRKDAETSLRMLAYTEKDFSHEHVGKQISDYTWVFLSENKPFVSGEETTYNRPIMLEKFQRDSTEHCLEADYFNTRIFDRRNQLVGWIEYSGTTDYHFPEIGAIKEIELLAEILSSVLESQDLSHLR